MGAERTIDMAEDKNIFFDSYELEQSDLADLADLFKQAKLIKSSREGKNIIYSLADEHVVTILKQGVDHILE